MNNTYKITYRQGETGPCTVRAYKIEGCGKADKNDYVFKREEKGQTITAAIIPKAVVASIALSEDSEPTAER